MQQSRRLNPYPPVEQALADLQQKMAPPCPFKALSVHWSLNGPAFEQHPDFPALVETLRGSLAAQTFVSYACIVDGRHAPSALLKPALLLEQTAYDDLGYKLAFQLAHREAAGHWRAQGRAALEQLHVALCDTSDGVNAALRAGLPVIQYLVPGATPVFRAHGRVHWAKSLADIHIGLLNYLEAY